MARFSLMIACSALHIFALTGAAHEFDPSNKVAADEDDKLPVLFGNDPRATFTNRRRAQEDSIGVHDKEKNAKDPVPLGLLLRSEDALPTACTGRLDWIGDGDCDDENDNEACGWDKGDCCKSECVAEDYFCNGVGDGEHKCLDSSSEDFSGLAEDAVTPPGISDFPDCDAVRTDWFQDGYCDSTLNNEVCGYDGGDCCECECVDAFYSCGSTDFYGNFDCQDPESCSTTDDTPVEPTTPAPTTSAKPITTPSPVDDSLTYSYSYEDMGDDDLAGPEPTASPASMAPTASPAMVPTASPAMAPTAKPVTAPTEESVTMCSNGIPGIESSKGACCVAACGRCGGTGCSSVAADLGLGSAECCEGEILENNHSCGEAPCVIVDPTTTPSPVDDSLTYSYSDDDMDDDDQCGADGIEGAMGGQGVCCHGDCGGCGGADCSNLDGGSSNCCAAPILASDVYCNDNDSNPPCIIGSRPLATQTCSNGIVGIGNADVCCPTACNQCGGAGCSGAGDEGFGHDECCKSGIMASEVYCDDNDENEAPCIIGSGSGRTRSRRLERE